MAIAWKTMAAAVMAAGLVGCASTGGSSGLPCARCTYGTSDGKAQPPKQYCVVDGKTVDCRADPAGCPSCAKLK